MPVSIEEIPPKSKDHETQQAARAAAPRQISLMDVMEKDARSGIQNYGRLPVAFVKGQGARLWDSAGKEYLDFLAGIAVVPLGHAHPRVTAAIANQAATLLHTSNIFHIEPQARLAEKLHEISGGMRAFFCNSGAEANEAAIKIVRKWQSAKDPERNEIVTFEGGFHGRTLGSLAATAQPKYHEGFGPMPGGFHYVAFNDAEALRAVVSNKTAAVMLEPIQGESGIRPAEDDFLREVRRICDEAGALLVFDEVQAGVGRTGKFFGHEWAGVKADVITLAKGLGNGVPIGALLATEEVAKALVPGTHGCTFGGNFLSCAAALATVDALYEEELMANSLKQGEYFSRRLREWGEKTGLVTQVRGRGLMVSAVLSKPVARELLKAALTGGLVLNAVGDDILRFLPPLNITEADVDEAIAKLEAAAASL